VPADKPASQTSADKATESERANAFYRMEEALLEFIDESIDGLQKTKPSAELRDHLEVLRSLLKGQSSAYLKHVSASKPLLFTQTSPMYAGAVAASGAITLTMRELIEGNTMTGGQAAKLSQYVSSRRTIIVFGDRTVGKSTLLNSLFETVSVDERFIAIERTQDLPALKDRSFCVRLTIDAKTDLGGLFAKAQRMQPGRLVVGEIHGEEINHFFYLLQRDPKIGGFATLRADSIHQAITHVSEMLGEALDAATVKALVAEVAPAFVHMITDEKGKPRLAAIWSVEGLDDDGEIILMEEQTN